MSATSVKADSKVTVRGSCELIRTYLHMAVNSVLYQRGIYPSEDFQFEEKFGITVILSSNPEIQAFLTRTLSQMEEWLLKKQIEKVGMVITDIASKKVVEAWEFNVEYLEPETIDHVEGGSVVQDKPLATIQGEIRHILRQILSTVSVLPLIDTRCSFDLNMYLIGVKDNPENWGEVSDPDFQATDQMPFRRFSTSYHGVETKVFYRTND